MTPRRFVSSFYGVAFVLALGIFVSAGALKAPSSRLDAVRPGTDVVPAVAALGRSAAPPRLDVYFVCSDAEKADVLRNASPAQPVAVVVYEYISGVHDEMRQQIDDWTETGEIGEVHLSTCD